MRMIWPIPGAPITDTFGPRDPIDTDGDGRADTSGFHHGLDLGADYQTPILAAAAGVVTFSGWYGSYGYVVFLDHGNGISTRYAHQFAPPPVGSGQHVEAGERIGFVGSTGASTGPHLHVEVLEHGTRVDPLPYLTETSTHTEREEEEIMMVTMRYTKAGVDHVIVGDTGSGFAHEYETRDSEVNGTTVDAFKTPIHNVDESIYGAFRESLARVRRGE